jgi:hypothetical protein
MYDAAGLARNTIAAAISSGRPTDTRLHGGAHLWLSWCCDLRGGPRAQQLLETALRVEGNIGNVYSRFHDYSITNMLLFLMQGVREPVASYSRWKALGRQVVRGAHAKDVIVPVLVQEPAPEGEPTDEQRERVARLVGFKVVRAVFGLSDTEGPELPPRELPGWDQDLALKRLGIRRLPFEDTRGNVQGYSHGLEVAINPVAVHPEKTLMHELGHIVLGHTVEHALEDYRTHRGIKEFQAESVAYITMNELGMLDDESATHSRGYIQHWLKGEQPLDKAIQQVFRATEAILKAGRVDPQPDPQTVDRER